MSVSFVTAQTRSSSPVFRFLGHLYAAEALISLDRISDAIAHLNPENVSDVSMGVLTSEQDQGRWLDPLLKPPSLFDHS